MFEPDASWFGRPGGRQTVRLPGYDYATPGAYFITVCTNDRVPLFANIRDGDVIPSAAGRIVHAAWRDLPAHHRHVMLDAWVVMPDHVHGIVVLTDAPRRAGDASNDVPHASDGVGAGSQPAPEIEPCPIDGNVRSASAGAGSQPAPEIGPWPVDLNAALAIAGARSQPIDPGALPTGAGAGWEPAPTVDCGDDARVGWDFNDDTASPRRHGLSEIIRGFKTFSARRINTLRNTPGRPVWQRNYHEHIIRDARSLRRIRMYIEANPAAWMLRHSVQQPPRNRP